MLKSYIKFLEGLPLILRIIFALPALDILWVIYRVARSMVKGNMLGVVLAIVLVVVGIPFMWLVDIICIILFSKVLWID